MYILFLKHILTISFAILGVQRSQSEKSKDKETFLANKAQQLPQKKPAGPTAKSEAVEIPGNFCTQLPYFFKSLKMQFLEKKKKF